MRRTKETRPAGKCKAVFPDRGFRQTHLRIVDGACGIGILPHRQDARATTELRTPTTI
jgi:hypothetical protein